MIRYRPEAEGKPIRNIRVNEYTKCKATLNSADSQSELNWFQGVAVGWPEPYRARSADMTATVETL